MVDKTLRSSETREKTARKKGWTRPSALDAPPLQMVTSIDGLGNQSEDLMIIKTSVEKYEKVGN